MGELTECPKCGKFRENVLECPSCGAKISPMDGVCPYCQTEISFKKSGKRFEDFIKELNEADKNVYGSYPRKIKIIENYQVANERSEILNFLYYALERVGAITNEGLAGYNWQLVKLWYSKAKATAEKAKVVMPNDKKPEEIFAKIQKIMKVALVKKYFWVPIVAAIVLILFVSSVVRSISDSISRDNQQASYTYSTELPETGKEEEAAYEIESSAAEEITETETAAAAENETEADSSGELSSSVKSIKNISSEAKEQFSDSDSKYDISKGKAKNAFEDYGAEEYPNGFKCHWILKNYKTVQRSDGSWFFTVGVTIKDDDGKKQDLTAEGTVYGSNESPQVKGFKVY